MEFSNTYARIDLDAIEENYRDICQKAGKPVMAVIKADAYGHGAVPVAKALEQLCPHFAVATVAEALELRNAGIQKPILVLGHTHRGWFAAAVERQITLGIASEDEAAALAREAARQGKTARVHLKLDTGMGRFGFLPGLAAVESCLRIAAMEGLKAEGLYSHFATADTADLTDTNVQAARFDTFDRQLQEAGLRLRLRHLDNSAGIMNFGCHYDMVRAGIVLYGLYPSDEVDPALLPLRPAMSWHTHVACLRLLAAGAKIGYGGTHTLQRDSWVATIPAGYADGYRRSLSGKFYVLIRGCKAPILGRVCMDQFMVDVTDISGVEAGEPVVLMGQSGRQVISAEEIGAAAGSFNYEQVCDLSRRVDRVYFRGGRQVGHVSYLLEEK